jgi:hypothetical protein
MMGVWWALIMGPSVAGSVHEATVEPVDSAKVRAASLACAVFALSRIEKVSSGISLWETRITTHRVLGPRSACYAIW